MEIEEKITEEEGEAILNDIASEEAKAIYDYTHR